MYAQFQESISISVMFLFRSLNTMKAYTRDLRMKTSDFSWNVGVGSFDALRVTIQGQFFLVVLDHRGPFHERALGGHDLSKKVWPWKVTVSRSNEHGRICPKKSDVFILRSLIHVWCSQAEIEKNSIILLISVIVTGCTFYVSWSS